MHAKKYIFIRGTVISSNWKKNTSASRLLYIISNQHASSVILPIIFSYICTYASMYNMSILISIDVSY